MLGIKPLENLKDALGGDLLSLIAGHDIDADRRQRNREFVGSGNCDVILGIHGGRCRLISSIPKPLIPSLVLP